MALKNSGIPSYTWAAKPAIANWPSYRPIIITDVGVGGSMWHHDGVNWYPVSGFFTLAKDSGSIATPLNTLTGVASGVFTLPLGNPLIPAGLLIPGQSIVTVQSRCRKSTSVAGASSVAYLGTNGSSADSIVANKGFTATGPQDVRVDSSVWFTTANAGTTDNNLAPMAAGGAASVCADVSTALNTAVNMFITMGITGANTGDSFSLLSYSVDIRV